MTLPYPLLWLLTSAFRFFPWPAKPGLQAVGQPGTDSPVFLTGNFALTVARLKRALRGLDGWLLVANSRGINVWCAAAGGHLTTHDAISALKTSGIAKRVAHRRVILPQLAATGIEAGQVRARTGWKVIWGPVDGRDLPAFLQGEETPAMRQVRFDPQQRLEMAVMWAAPLSLLAPITLIFWPGRLLPLVALIWALSLAVYLAFPLYEPLVARKSLAGFVVLFGGLTLAGIALTGTLTGRLTLPFILRWGGLGLGMALLLAFDLAGSTPLYKSWTHAERSHRVTLEPEHCTACGRCAQVCPRGVFTVAEIAALPHADRCEQCGACIVQCPTDALLFEAPDGERVPPETMRRYKLNMMGQRGRKL
ncbi:MAG TPA: 4Fe-4S binding protein [Thermoflexia bacterium]|nr:4Fe-4S binding protein [Thermoflexia bacterium]